MAVRVTLVVFCCYCCYDVDVNACGTLPLLPVSCPTKQKNDNIALLPVPPDQLERGEINLQGFVQITKCICSSFKTYLSNTVIPSPLPSDQ